MKLHWKIIIGITLGLCYAIFISSKSDRFQDLNANQSFDLKDEPFVDLNNNKICDQAEEFIDENNSGHWDKGEDFTDIGNDVWDKGEDFTDTNEDGLYDLGEDFTDIGNGVWDKGEDFTDKDGNKVWDRAEIFIDQDGKEGFNDGYIKFTENWIKPFGTIFLSLIKLFAIPLILVSLIKGISSISNISRL